jgi:hypothetical protein
MLDLENGKLKQEVVQLFHHYSSKNLKEITRKHKERSSTVSIAQFLTEDRRSLVPRFLERQRTFDL